MAGGRFQPLLLLGAVIAYLPLLLSAAEHRWWLAPGAVALAAASVLAWWWGRRPAVTAAHRHAIGLALAVVTLASYVVMLEIAPSAVELLPFAVLLITALGLSSQRTLRLLLQAAAIGVVAWALARHGAPGPEAAVVVLLLIAIVAIVDLFAAQLTRARAAQRAARRQAAERAALLMAVQRLSGRHPDQAAHEVVGTLRGLGFAYAEVITDASDARATVNGQDAPAEVVQVPVAVGGQVRGQILVGPARGAGCPEDLNLVEVLAAHLGAVWETQEHLERQQDRLRRATELERARTGFLDAVSEELHLPLTEIRAGAAALRAGGLDGAPDTRVLEVVGAQGQRLVTIIDALLDVPRLHADGTRRIPAAPGARIQPVKLGAVIAGFRDRVELRGDGLLEEHRVVVAPVLLDHALSLWLELQGSSGARLVVERGSAGVTLRLRRHPSAPGHLVHDTRRVRPLVTRLLVAAGARWDGGPVVLLPADAEVREGGP